MKKITFMKKMIFTLLLCLGGSVSSWAQVAGWNFSTQVGGAGNYGTSPLAATTNDANVTVGGLTRGSGFGTLTGTAAGSAWGATNFTASGTLAGEITANKYFTFTLTAKSDYKVSLSGIAAYNVRRSASGATKGQWQYQIGSGSFINIGSEITWGAVTTSAGNSQTAIDLTGFSDLQNVLSTSTITIRLVCYGASATTGTMYLKDLGNVSANDLIINGTVAAASTPAPVVTPASPTGTVGVAFNYQIVASNTPTSYAVSSGTLPDGLTLNTTTGEITGLPTTAGTPSVSVTATNAGGTSDPATLNFTIASAAGQAQFITFGALSAKTYGNSKFKLTASATSTLPVSFASSNTAVATVSGDSVTIVGAGSADITASQAGNGTYNPATSVVQSLTVDPIMLTVASLAVTSKTYTGTNAATITGTLVGVINSDDVSLVGAGLFADVNVGTSISVTSNCSLSGTKAGNYTLIPISGLIGDITKASQTITFGALASKVATDAAFALSATASSALGVTYASSNEAVATVSGNMVTLVAGGTTTITATQAGNGNYDAAVAVPQTLSVNYAAPVASAATRQTGNSMFANWAVVPGATGYLVSVYKKSGTGISYTALSENFDGFTAGTTTAPTGTDAAATTLDGKTQIIGWTGYKVFDAAGTIKMGTSSVLGYIVTPSIDLSGNGGNFSINFKSMAWSTDSVVMKIYLNDALVNYVRPLNNDASYTLSPFSIDLTGGTATSKIKFEGNQAVKGRFFMEDLVVTSGVSPVLSPIAGSPFPVMGGAMDSIQITGLSYDTYYYTVKATDGVMTSAASNEISFVIDATTNIFTPSADRMYVANGRLFVTGSQAFSVYNTQGVQVASVAANSASNSIALRPGIYVVKTATKVQKVVVR